jgi:hypothetical protein
MDNRAALHLRHLPRGRSCCRPRKWQRSIKGEPDVIGIGLQLLGELLA